MPCLQARRKVLSSRQVQKVVCLLADHLGSRGELSENERRAVDLVQQYVLEAPQELEEALKELRRTRSGRAPIHLAKRLAGQPSPIRKALKMVLTQEARSPKLEGLLIAADSHVRVLRRRLTSARRALQHGQYEQAARLMREARRQVLREPFLTRKLERWLTDLHRSMVGARIRVRFLGRSA